MSKPLLILMHGLGRSKYSMKLLESYFQKREYETYNHGYKSRYFSIEHQADLLNQQIAEKYGNNRELFFITHSLGSIILRKFALTYGENYKLRRAVMMGPPNQGSSFARKISTFKPIANLLGPAFSELCSLSLAPATDLIEVGILAGGKRGPRGYSPFVEGDNDGIVACSETILEGSKDHLIVNGVHTFLMIKPSIMRQIESFLNNGKFKVS